MELSKETQDYIKKAQALKAERQKLNEMKAKLNPKELDAIKNAKNRENIPRWKDLIKRKAESVARDEERIAGIEEKIAKSKERIAAYAKLVKQAGGE